MSDARPLEFGPVTPNGGRFTRDLRPGDRIIVPDSFGTVTIPVTVLAVRFYTVADATISYRRDAAEGGRRDYLHADALEVWPVALEASE